jgi:phosphatidylinositol-3-phosphatase
LSQAKEPFVHRSLSDQSPVLRTLAAAAAILLSCSGQNPGSSGSSIGSGDRPPVDPPPSSSGPQLSGLAAGTVVSGAVDLAASAPAGTARVDFQVDGSVVASAPAPFSATWDSFSVTNGTHDVAVLAIDGAGAATSSAAVRITVSNHIKTVFVIVLENHDWSSIQGAASAPYINQTLLAEGAHAGNYMNVPGLHPSLPNYIWMEAGSTLGVTDDAAPAYHKLTTSQHLVTLLKNAGLTWRAYQEDIPGTDCPLTNVNQYAPKHLPMIYFTDVNGGVNRSSSECISHIRPYTELSRDLETDAVAAYNFITPNLCNDMHDCSIATGDAWLAREVPRILASKAYRDGGALFVTFDESAGSDVPIGFIALSPLVKPGYSNTIRYTHSSLLRSVQEIFGVTPLLGDAANATNISDLFRSFP